MKNYTQALSSVIPKPLPPSFLLGKFIEQPSKGMFGIIVDLKTNEEILTESYGHSKTNLYFYNLSFVGPNKKLKRAVNIMTINDCFENFERLVQDIKKNKFQTYQTQNFLDTVDKIKYYFLNYKKPEITSPLSQRGLESYKNLRDIVRNHEKTYNFLKNL